MMTIIEQVESWYRDNAQRFADSLNRMDIFPNTSDPIRGGVVIEMETPALVASITFWNKGDVAVLGLHKESKKDFIFDDRTLKPGENIPGLLERYFQQIIEQN